MMLSRLDRSLMYAAHAPRLKPFFDGDGGTGPAGPGGDTGTTGPSGPTGTTGGTASGFQPIMTEEDARAFKDGLRKNLLDEVRRQVAAEQTQREADAQRQRDQDAAAARGDFETAKQQLQADRDTARTERDAANIENQRLREAITAGLKAGWEALPETIRALGERSHPEDDVLGRWEFLHDPTTLALVKQLEKGGDPPRGSGTNPPIGTTGERSLAEETAALAASGKYSL